jgi:hypothetical protein
MWPNRADPVSPSVIGASEPKPRIAALPFGEANRGIDDAVALFPEVSVPSGSVA